VGSIPEEEETPEEGTEEGTKEGTEEETPEEGTEGGTREEEEGTREEEERTAPEEEQHEEAIASDKDAFNACTCTFDKISPSNSSRSRQVMIFLITSSLKQHKNSCSGIWNSMAKELMASR
jgi:hypothetical protein